MAAKYSAGEYLSPRTLLAAVTVLMVISALMHILSGISSVMQYELLGRIAGAGPWTQQEAELNDLREGAIGMATVAVYIVTAILFLKLLGRFNHNAWSFGAEGMEYTPGWTVGWFFVPFMNLFRPSQVVQEIWKVSQPGPPPWGTRPSSGLVSCWWALWIISNVLGQITMRMAMANENMELIRTATLISIAESALDVVLVVIATRMVRQIASMQEARQASGERYDNNALHCAACGEPITGSPDRCPLCGASLEDALVVVE